MTLIVDTGVLFAATKREERYHVPCRKLLETSQERIVVPASTLVELDFLFARDDVSFGMLSLLESITKRGLWVEDPTPDDYQRISEILDRYSDQDVSFVDAAVLAVVERLGETKLATLDHRHFSILRPKHVKSLKLLPPLKSGR
ncbi:MAG: type II toxin-antitoxin system VapC family toxin [Actinomycetota bacterium]